MLTPGDRIGDWEILLPLGQGGMGSVFRCRHALSHRIEAAVKVLKPTDISGARERFIREAEALHALSHPAIVRVHGFGQDAPTGLLWLAMELVDGQNFEHLLQDGAFPRERATDIFASVADGLAYAHSRGIVHRDIKPANLMLRDDGRAVLLDFGIAVQEGHDRLTQEGVVPGTVAYAAPEQVTFGEHNDPALADTYALGQVLCECLTGRFTFPRDTSMNDQRRAVQILKKKLRMRPLDPGPGVEERVRELVQSATEPDPARRGPPLSQWAGVLGPEPRVVERTALRARPAELDMDLEVASLPRAATLIDGEDEVDDVDLDGSSVEVVPRDLALPGPVDDGPDDLLDAETEVRGRGGFPWVWLVGSVLAVVLLGLGLVLAGGIAGGAAWWTLQEPSAPPADESRLGDVLSPEVDPEPGELDTDAQLDVPAPDLATGASSDGPVEPGIAARPVSRATPRVTGSGDARLVVAADQPASVYLDGALIRMTPLTRRLDAGSYDVRMVAGGGREKRFRVHLQPGETARRIWDFDDGEWRSFEGGLDTEGLPARPRTGGLEARVRDLPGVKACLAAEPQPWTVSLRFVVVPDGSIAADGIEPDSLAGSTLEDCLFDAVRTLQLGQSQAGAVVRVRLPSGG